MNGIRFISLVIAALSAFTVYLIISSTDPLNIAVHIKSLFYTALAVCICSSILFMRLSLHPYLRKTALEPLPILPVIRQGIIVSMVMISFLLLLSLRSFSIIDGILIIAAAFLFELFFRVRIPLKTEKQL